MAGATAPDVTVGSTPDKPDVVGATDRALEHMATAGHYQQIPVPLADPHMSSASGKESTDLGPEHFQGL
jgi:hypothetical protein